MSSYIQPQVKTYKAGGAIEKYRFVKFGAADNLVVKSAAGEKAFGSYQNPHYDAAQNDEVEISHLGGGGLVQLAGTVTRGDSIASDANGLGVLGTATQWCPAIAMESGVAGDVISILFDGHYLPA